MRQRLALAGQDPDLILGPDVPEGASTATSAFARARALKAGLEGQAQQRRN